MLYEVITEEQTDFYFFYNRDQFDDSRVVKVNFENRKINEVLDELFSFIPPFHRCI